METINHDAAKCRFETVVEGYTAYVEYRVTDGVFDVVHTIVPPAIGGRGIAARLVEAAYLYAQARGYRREATCSYARVWLERNGL